MEHLKVVCCREIKIDFVKTISSHDEISFVTLSKERKWSWAELKQALGGWPTITATINSTVFQSVDVTIAT